MTSSDSNGVPLAVGIAGWSYADWRDTVYRLSSHTVQPSLFDDMPAAPANAAYPSDTLRFISKYVDMIEINSSFYRIPASSTAATWASRVSDRTEFFFTAKLNREFTHSFSRDPSLAAQYREAFDPLRKPGLLHGILAQFRYDFNDSEKNRSTLSWIHDQFANFAPLILEVRHRSWADSEAVGFLSRLDSTIANLDYPLAADSFDVRHNLVGRKGYFRLHGRNRTAWFDRTTPVYETYNYDYSDGEIEELADRSRDLMKEVKELTIVANNHYRGKAVSAAVRLKSALLEQKVPIPPALMETYPSLRAKACP